MEKRGDITSSERHVGQRTRNYYRHLFFASTYILIRFFFSIEWYIWHWTVHLYLSDRVQMSIKYHYDPEILSLVLSDTECSKTTEQQHDSFWLNQSMKSETVNIRGPKNRLHTYPSVPPQTNIVYVILCFLGLFYDICNSLDYRWEIASSQNSGTSTEMFFLLMCTVPHQMNHRKKDISCFFLVTWHLFFCPSWRGILLSCSPEGFFIFFYLERVFFCLLGVFPDPMWGQRSGMSMCTDCKALWGEFVICGNGLYKINCIEFFIHSPFIPCVALQGIFVKKV